MTFEEQKEQLNLKPELKASEAWTCSVCDKAFDSSLKTCPYDGGVILPPPPDGFPHKDKYRFEAEIGRGGMGVVYKARQNLVDKTVAIKVMYWRGPEDTVMRRFQNEARVIFSLDNEHIVRIFDFGLSDTKQPYMVMDYIDGESLSARLKGNGAMSIEESLPVFLQICNAMGDAHFKGVLHRDIKPGNILLTKDKYGETFVKIIDFGIAKVLRPEDGSIENLTATGELLGSPLYMSPEQARGAAMDQRSDIYSMGCLIYEVLTGCPPIVGISQLDTLMRQVTEKAPSLSEGSLKQKFPPKLEAIVAKCLAKSPDARYQSMSELASALEDFRKDPHGRVQTTSAQKPQKREQSATALVIALSGLLFIATAALIVLFINKSMSDHPARPFPQERLSEDVSGIPANFEAGEEARVQAEEFARNRTEVVYSHHKEVDDRFVHAHVREWENATGINLDDTNIGDAGLRDIAAHIKSLQVLELNNTKITGAGLVHLIRLPKLRVLDVGYDKLKPSDFASIGKIMTLERLDAFGATAKDEGLRQLAHLHNLKWLNLQSAQITDAGLAALKDKPITFLAVHGNPDITDRGVITISHLPIQTLLLSGTGITDASLNTLLRMEYLKSVEVDNTAMTAGAKRRLRQHNLSVGNFR